MESDVSQSALSLAWKDTKASFHQLRFFWGVETGSVSLFIYGGTVLTPEDASKFVAAAYPAIGGIIGAVIGFGIIFAIKLFWAPYKQRNEARQLLQAKPRPIPLPNRKELRSAIASVEITTIQLVNKKNQYDDIEKNGTPRIWKSNALNKAYHLWDESINELRRQYLVAGDAYEALCVELVGFLLIQIGIKMGFAKPPDGELPAILKDSLQFIGLLTGRIKQALRKVDELSGQALDKEGSQTE